MYALAASAAGVGVLAIAPSAEAKVIYTPTHVVLTPNSYYRLDLNSDGVTDFTIIQNNGEESSGVVSFEGLDAPALNKWIVTKGPGATFPEDIKAGEMIGPRQYSNGQFSSGNWYVFSAGWPARRAPRFHGWANDGKGATNRYLGLRFAINGQFHYGWARMSVRISRDECTTTITGYAYETVTGKGILSGNTGGTTDTDSKPATLGQLAAGRK